MESCFKKLLFVLIVLFIAGGCNDQEDTVYLTSDFESGSIGDVLKVNEREWELSLAADNANVELPDHWRNWWYIRMDNLPLDRPVVIHLKNRGWPYYYLPVYSYDQETWFRFAEDQVSEPGEYELRMEKRFEATTVWMARFYPYTYSDLKAYLRALPDNPHVRVEKPAVTQDGNPIYLVTLTDEGASDAEKQRVWIHARTHPGEIGPSFMLEGMMDFLLSGAEEAENVLAKYIIHIVPMQNIDGVVAGNYRTTSASENLEVMWYSDPDTPMELTNDAPMEVAALHEIISTLTDQGPPFTIALNLHASNSEPDVRPFFYPHFGPEGSGYSPAETSLWNKQIRFIKCLAFHYGEDMLEPVPGEGGSSFASKTYPESWWWKNFQDDVMAITMETTYGRAGYAPGWLTPDDLRNLGESMALALGDYAADDIGFLKHGTGTRRNNWKTILKYPELYPPHAADEMKE